MIGTNFPFHFWIKGFLEKNKRIVSGFLGFLSLIEKLCKVTKEPILFYSLKMQNLEFDYHSSDNFKNMSKLF